MADADRCYLNIPWKEYARLLEKALANVEGVDLEVLRTIGSQEFDNYKAIERRVNDDTCGGDCDCIAAVYYGNNNGSIILTKGGTESSFYALDPITESGGMTHTTTAFRVPSDGLYWLSQRVRVVLNNIDLGTWGIGTDSFDQNDQDRMNGSCWITTPSPTFAFIASSRIIQVAANTAILPRCRIDTLTTTTGDSVDVDDSWFSISKICGCNTGP